MIFIATPNFYGTSYLNASRVKYNARMVVLLASKYSTEKLLDKYLRENYNKGLVETCLDIIDGADYLTDTTNNVIITFRNKELNKLASLITFGTGGKIQGSNILKLAFEGN